MIRGFFIHNESWYANRVPLEKGVTDEITLGLYNEGGAGTAGEMSVSWIDIGDVKPYAKLEIPDDFFHLLNQFSDVFKALADKGRIQPEGFKELLKDLGFTDLTKRGR